MPIVFVDRIFGESKLGTNEIIIYLKGVWKLFNTFWMCLFTIFISNFSSNTVFSLNQFIFNAFLWIFKCKIFVYVYLKKKIYQFIKYNYENLKIMIIPWSHFHRFQLNKKKHALFHKVLILFLPYFINFIIYLISRLLNFL